MASSGGWRAATLAASLWALGCGARDGALAAESFASSAAGPGAGGGAAAGVGGGGGACDVDGDGYGSRACGGDDCDDDAPSVHPGAAEGQPGPWSVETIASRGDTGWSTAVAVDGAGGVHVTFVDMDASSVAYAFRGEGGWSFDTIGPTTYSTGGWGMTSLVLDADGIPRVSYRDGSGSLHVVARTADAWSLPELVDGAQVEHSALAVGPDGALHVAYIAQPGGLRHALRRSGGWTTDTIDPDVGSGVPPALAVDASGVAHVGYMLGWDVRYARGVPGSWQLDTLDTQTGVVMPAIAAAADGVAHLTYVDPIEHDLLYTTNASGAWVREAVDATGGLSIYSRVVLDVDGAPHVAYGRDADLVVARREAGAWTLEVVDGRRSWSGATPAIALEPSRVAHVVCRSSLDQWQDNDLRYATSRPPPDGVDADCDGYEW